CGIGSGARTCTRPTPLGRGGYAHDEFLAQHRPALRIERQYRVAILSFVDEPLMDQGAGGAPPSIGRALFPSSVNAQGVVSARAHARAARAAQDVDDWGCSEALSALREARDAGHEL